MGTCARHRTRVDTSPAPVTPAAAPAPHGKSAVPGQAAAARGAARTGGLCGVATRRHVVEPRGWDVVGCGRRPGGELGSGYWYGPRRRRCRVSVLACVLAGSGAAPAATVVLIRRSSTAV